MATKQQNLDDHKIKKEVLEVVKKYGKLPVDFRFDNDIFDLNKALGVDKTAKLLYDGKKDKRTIIDKTISAPFQEIRKFGISKEKSEIEKGKNWYNKLIYGDNLQALKYLLDNGYKEQVRLIYIDPPFATKSDFKNGEVKAYRDKLEGAEFIEFLRERLFLMRELLADDGSIYLHLDQKMSHYIKLVLDEIFGKEKLRNEIIWHYETGGVGKTKFAKKHDTIFFYSKCNSYLFYPERVKDQRTEKSLKRAQNPTGARILSSDKLKYPMDVWNIQALNPMEKERLDYPTQKPEKLLERIIKASSNENDLVLDAFVGSGTTCGVAEKLNRKWIGIDAGKLAIYTSQKRILDIKNHKPFIVMNSGLLRKCLVKN